MRLFLEALIKGRFGLFLATMVAMFFITPLVGNQTDWVEDLLGWLTIVVLLSCIRAISNTRKFFIFMTLFSLFNVALTGMELVRFDDSPYFLMLVLSSKVVYFGIVFVSIMRFVLNNELVTTDKICGAISAYLLMGVIWAFVYTTFYILDPSSFKIPESWLSDHSVSSFWAMYFSFTTLTTLGYGDITPQTPLTQSYAVMEAAIGQIFLAVIVARLIALHISTRHKSNKSSEG